MRRANLRPFLLLTALATLIVMVVDAVTAEAQNVPSDHKILSVFIANMMDGPDEAITKVRAGAADPVHGSNVRRLGVCVDRYAAAIAQDARLRTKVAEEVDHRVCARDVALCRSAAKQQILQLQLGADVMKVLAAEMRGVRTAETSDVFRSWNFQVNTVGRLLRQLAQTDWVLAQTLQDWSPILLMVGELQATRILEACESSGLPFWVYALGALVVAGIGYAAWQLRVRRRPAV
jgi:hypothetical protein